MGRLFKVRARIEAEDRASATIGKVEGRFKRLTSLLKGGLVAASLAAVAALAGLVRGLRSSVDAAKAQEDAVKRLDTALGSLGPTAAGVSARLQEYATELQGITTAGDETIIGGQALLASFTKNEDEIRAATAAALDLSAATGTDLSAAFLLLGKAVSGETSSLSRYGISLDEGLSKSEKFAAAIAKINEQFGGQAAAQAQTFSGTVAQVSNAFGDLEEQVGFAITKNEEIIGQLRRLRDTLSDPATQKSAAALGEGLVSIGSNAAELVVAIPNLAAGLGSLFDAFGKFDAEKTGGGFAAVGRELANWADIIVAGELFRNLTALGEATAAQAAAAELAEVALFELTLRQAGYSAEAARSIAASSSLNAELAKSAAQIDAVATAEDRLSRIRKEETDQLVALTEVTKALGVTLEAEVNVGLERNAAALIAADEAARRGVISYTDLANIQAAVAASNIELAESLTGISAGATDAAESTVILRDGLAILNQEQPRTQNALRETEQRFRSASAAAIQFAAITGSSVAARDSRSQGDIDAAVAAGQSTTLGGTRIRLPGGGSRLLGNRDFTGLNN